MYASDTSLERECFAIAALPCTCRKAVRLSTTTRSVRAVGKRDLSYCSVIVLAGHMARTLTGRRHSFAALPVVVSQVAFLVSSAERSALNRWPSRVHFACGVELALTMLADLSQRLFQSG